MATTAWEYRVIECELEASPPGQVPRTVLAAGSDGWELAGVVLLHRTEKSAPMGGVVVNVNSPHLAFWLKRPAEL